MRFHAIKILCLLSIVICQDYGWKSYPSNYVRDIYSSDMSQRLTLPAVPVARLTNQQKLPILCSPVNSKWLPATASGYEYEVKPASAGVVVSNSASFNEAYFIPNDKFHSMGLINVTARNKYDAVVIGQIHFIVRNP